MIREKFDLTGKTALVTGSARGIGRAIAAAFAEFGARVFVHGVKPSDPLSAALAACQAFNPACESVTGDLGDPAAVEAIFAHLRERDALPDILVANASIQKNIHWSEFDAAEAHHEMEVNFHATLRMFQLAYPKMKEQHWGRLIVVGSVQEMRPHPEMCAYAASKAALENLVRNLARQIAREGITVNDLCPGVFATDRNAAALGNPVYAERVMNAIPMHDYARPEDAAGAALLLASDAGRYITGSTILIDGGLRLPG
ncbi:MAG: SDR family oxidoreductase [Kiritimatiellae bacterium]|nr:SDR family oxidoreductase [Kiritimatiellia bacterium]